MAQETRTLYQWSRVDGRISNHIVRRCRGGWVEEWETGWTWVEDGFWQETAEAARAAAREHFERERARIEDALTYLRGEG